MDEFDLDRFVDAQAGHLAAALAELRGGAKRTHWMWFIFPQIAGLGSSATARAYAIGSLAEARAYLAHPVLGPRYGTCLDALADLPRADAAAVFGPIDAVKLRSSLTLFATAGLDPAGAALARWFGAPDPLTLALLGAADHAPPADAAGTDR